MKPYKLWISNALYAVDRPEFDGVLSDEDRGRIKRWLVEQEIPKDRYRQGLTLIDRVYDDVKERDLNLAKALGAIRHELSHTMMEGMAGDPLPMAVRLFTRPSISTFVDIQPEPEEGPIEKRPQDALNGVLKELSAYPSVTEVQRESRAAIEDFLNVLIQSTRRDDILYTHQLKRAEVALNILTHDLGPRLDQHYEEGSPQPSESISMPVTASLMVLLTIENELKQNGPQNSLNRKILQACSDIIDFLTHPIQAPHARRSLFKRAHYQLTMIHKSDISLDVKSLIQKFIDKLEILKETLKTPPHEGLEHKEDPRRFLMQTRNRRIVDGHLNRALQKVQESEGLSSEERSLYRKMLRYLGFRTVQDESYDDYYYDVSLRVAHLLAQDRDTFFKASLIDDDGLFVQQRALSTLMLGFFGDDDVRTELRGRLLMGTPDVSQNALKAMMAYPLEVVREDLDDFMRVPPFFHFGHEMLLALAIYGDRSLVDVMTHEGGVSRALIPAWFEPYFDARQEGRVIPMGNPFFDLRTEAPKVFSPLNPEEGLFKNPTLTLDLLPLNFDEMKKTLLSPVEKEVQNKAIRIAESLRRRDVVDLLSHLNFEDPIYRLREIYHDEVLPLIDNPYLEDAIDVSFLPEEEIYLAACHVLGEEIQHYIEYKTFGSTTIQMAPIIGRHKTRARVRRFR